MIHRNSTMETTCLLRNFILFTISFQIGAAFNACTPGFYLSPSSKTCAPCPAGTYQPSYGAAGCIPCSPGFISTSTASTICTSCRKDLTSNMYNTACVCPGGHAFNSDSGICRICPPGSASISSEDSAYCNLCPPNSYQPSVGATSCLPCPTNFSSASGATKCLECPKDQVPVNGTCGRCSPGNFYEPYSGICSRCVPGTFQDKVGVDSTCKECPENSYAGYGFRSCVFCERRTALMKDGSCASCKGGEQYNEYSLSCLKCSADQYSPRGRVFKYCFVCGPDSHSFQGSEKCVKCKEGTTLLSSGRCGKCPAGTRIDADNGRVCTKCLPNTFSLRGTMHSCLRCPSSLYSVPGSERCQSCPKGTALIATTGKCEICSLGKTYDRLTGLCKECNRGSFKPSAGIGQCRSCPKGFVSSKDSITCVRST